VIAVGADDTLDTADASDDAVADFSSRGADGRAPDVLAPGVGIISLRVPDGDLDQEFPQARIGERGFRGSGTSQAAAVVSAGVARLLSTRGTLTPDAVKALLRATARPLPGVDPNLQGRGLIDLAAAQVAPAGATAQQWPAAIPGPWRAAAFGLELAVERPGARWTASRWTASRWTASRWTASRWTASRWTASRWTASRWTASRWTTADWGG
jgi:serine protease AprX